VSFDINAVLKDMLAAVKDTVGEDWGDIKDYAQQVLKNEKEMLDELAKQRLRGEITDEELLSELDDERDTVAAELRAIAAMNKAMAQGAAKAAMGVLFNAVKVAL